MKIVKGIPASSGIKIAKAYKIEDVDLNFKSKSISNIEEQINILNDALKKSIDQLDDIKKKALFKLSDEELEVFEAHKLMLLDPEIKTQVESAIKDQKIDAASAVKQQTDIMIDMFKNMDNEYFQARASDIEDIRKRLIANILGLNLPDISSIQEEVIIIADDLTPSETSQLNKDFTLGFVTNIGGRTSHAAIMARSMEIPAVVGTGKILDEANDGDMIILDALDGNVYINPTEEEIEKAKTKMKQYEEDLKALEQFKNKDSLSKDGHKVEIVANIGTPDDLEGVIKNTAEGVGLYRTEFLYMNGKELPSEEIQFEAYKRVLESMGSKPVIVRTLDIGGDKNLEYLKVPEEMNPFLGYRAIRLCLDRPDIFRVQLRALLRASVYGNLKIMFPMVATLQEYREAKKLLLEEKEKLKSESIAVSDNIEIGIMVEIPSTAVMADTFAKEVDFFSIGTNDLIQYTMACDRLSDRVAYLYQPYNPAILRLVKNVVDAANKEGKWAGMCGEMASDPIAIPILLGIGLHEFSMSATSVLESRMLISKMNKKEIEKHIEHILNLSTDKEVEEYVKEKIMD